MSVTAHRQHDVLQLFFCSIELGIILGVDKIFTVGGVLIIGSFDGR